MKILLALIILAAVAGCDLSVTNDAGVRQIRWKISPWPPTQVTLVPAPPPPPTVPPVDDRQPVVYREDF